ncbi:hypothetical protein, partial [Novipirellula herctigrandis]|uniref:hypothetical protein n=1 Tax=Novipirellula herctigrandis TaxID=2527986 RepID=UPI003AF3BAA0
GGGIKLCDIFLSLLFESIWCGRLDDHVSANFSKLKRSSENATFSLPLVVCISCFLWLYDSLVSLPVGQSSKNGIHWDG